MNQARLDWDQPRSSTITVYDPNQHVVSFEPNQHIESMEVEQPPTVEEVLRRTLPEEPELVDGDTDKDSRSRTRVQRLMEDMDDLKRAIRADSSNSRAQAEQVLLSRSGVVDKFTFAKESQGKAKAAKAWNQNASTQSELDHFMERLNNVESTVSIYR